MSTHRIVIDRSLCSGFGTCAEMAPELFDNVAAACPMGAIAVYDDAGEHAA
jgi:ferredoxin